MKRLFALALAASPACADSAFPADEGQALQAGLTRTADGFILPGYDAWATAAEGLHGALQGYCAGTGTLEAPQEAFAETYLAWQRISVVQMGPITAAEGPMRVLLWPDPKGFADRAVRMATQAEDPAMTAPGGLEGRSIALVNMGALEDLVFDAGLAPGSYPCDLAVAIAGYQADLSAGIAAAWTPGADYRDAFDTAVAGNSRYPQVDDALRELFSGVTVQIAKIAGDQIGRGLGPEPGAARAVRTEARDSGLGLASLAASFRGLSGLYTVDGGVFDVAADIGSTAEHRLLAGTALSIADDLDALPQTLPEIAEEDGAAAEDLRALVPLVDFHDTYLTVTLPGSIGLTAGFSASDGD